MTCIYLYFSAAKFDLSHSKSKAVVKLLCSLFSKYFQGTFTLSGFGITHAGDLVPRGIEIRRHDVPNFIKQFQTESLYALFDCKDSVEVMSKGYENALLIVTKTIDKV